MVLVPVPPRAVVLTVVAEQNHAVSAPPGRENDRAGAGVLYSVGRYAFQAGERLARHKVAGKPGRPDLAAVHVPELPVHREQGVRPRGSPITQVGGDDSSRGRLRDPFGRPRLRGVCESPARTSSTSAAVRRGRRQYKQRRRRPTGAGSAFYQRFRRSVPPSHKPGAFEVARLALGRRNASPAFARIRP